jgi:hypothetical protein
MNGHSPTDDMFPHNQWDGTNTGSKRSHDYAVEDFFTDMKKRRMNPSYDPRKSPLFFPLVSALNLPTGMAERLERLNHISYSHHGGSGFNPRSVSLDIRTPEELAAVNDFLITLGREVTDSGPRPHHGSGFSSESYFDPVSLSQLGLAGMPGMPSSAPHDHPDHPYPPSGHNYSSAPYSSARSTHPSVQPGQYGGSMYPNIDDHPLGYPGEYHGRRPSKYAPYPQHYHQNHSPPHDGGSPQSGSNHSTPPQINLPPPDAAAYNFVRASRGAPPVPQLASDDYMDKSVQRIILLKSAGAPTTRPQPLEPTLPAAPHRGPPARLEPASSTTRSPLQSGSLYPLLTSGDVQYKLPPMKRAYRSPSPTSRASTPSAGSTQGSPTPSEVTILPPLRSIAPPLPPVRARTSTTESDDVARDLGRIQLERRAAAAAAAGSPTPTPTTEAPGSVPISAEERRRHAELIRNLLVSINTEFRRMYGTPPVPVPAPPARDESSRDVEMTAA